MVKIKGKGREEGEKNSKLAIEMTRGKWEKKKKKRT